VITHAFSDVFILGDCDFHRDDGAIRFLGDRLAAARVHTIDHWAGVAPTTANERAGDAADSYVRGRDAILSAGKLPSAEPRRREVLPTMWSCVSAGTSGSGPPGSDAVMIRIAQ